MKAKTFEKLIRKIVREEIDYAFRREIKSLTEDIRDEITPIITEKHNNISEKNKNTELNKNFLKERIMGKPLQKSPMKQKFAGDNTLNDLLNETAQGDTNLNGTMSPVSLDENFSAIGEMPTPPSPYFV